MVVGFGPSRLAYTIAADYDKLRTVGVCASPDPNDWPSCPFDHADWQFTQSDQAAAAEGLLPASEIWAYGQLLPAKYTAWRLPPWWRRRVSDNDEFRGQTAFSAWFPFKGLPHSAEMAKPIYRNLPTHDHTVEVVLRPVSRDIHSAKTVGETWQIFALGFLQGEGVITSPWVMHFPARAVTNKLFDRVGKGGLGVDPETFFDLNFQPKPLEHYPERDTNTGWCVGLRPTECH